MGTCDSKTMHALNMSSIPVNPIVPGFAPDPSACVVDGRVFLVNSSFHLFPGLPVYTSEDLINWRFLGEHLFTLDANLGYGASRLIMYGNVRTGNAVNRSSQLSLSQSRTIICSCPGDNVCLVAGGLYAPTIRHNKGITYIFCTNVAHGSSNVMKDRTFSNFFIYTKDILAGSWSNPVYYSFRGIDPSVFFDEDGKAYVQGKMLPSSHIYNLQIDLPSGKVLSEPKLIWEGWDKRATEGPHVYKKDGFYYLSCAEGGTFDHHMTCFARSKSIWGPYESNSHNPIWTSHATDNYVQNTGHADFFQDMDGLWWAVLLGVRMKAGRFILGRETFITPVNWPRRGWPSIEYVGLEVTGRAIADLKHDEEPGASDWVFLRDPDLQCYEFSPLKIKLASRPVPLSSEDESPCFIGKRQRFLTGCATVSLHVPDYVSDASLEAGIALYKDEHRFASLSYNFEAKSITFTFRNKARKITKDQVRLLPGSTRNRKEDISLAIRYTSETYKFLAGTESDTKRYCYGELDTLLMSDLDFTGPLIGIFAFGISGDVEFNNFTVDCRQEQGL